LIAVSMGLVYVLTGCGGEGVKPVALYKPNKQNIVLQPKLKTYVENGYLVHENKKLFDENGDIVKVLKLGDETFYMLKYKNSTFSLKDINQKVVKDFEATAFQINYTDNTVLISVRKDWNQNSYYDTVYEFDGKEVNIVNKNIKPGGIPTGIYNHYAYYNAEDIAKKKSLLNLKTNQTITLLYGKRCYVGAIDDKIFYIDSIGGHLFDKHHVLKMYDPKTDKTLAIAQKDDHVQFLKHNDQIVLKIFTGPEFSSQTRNHHGIPSNYEIPSNQTFRYIYLNTLEEVDGVAENFKPIVLTRLPNYITTNSLTYFTYTINDLDNIFSDVYRSYPPIF